jgi:SAM-dependent methyltransferase
MPYDLDLFAGCAPYYWRYRTPYAPEAIAFAVARLGLTRESRILDLGCGPGTLALDFAPRVGEVIALDADPEMLPEARRLAEETHADNVRWIQAGSEELGQFDWSLSGASLGQSFHWMDRDQVLRDINRLIDGDGGLALVNPGRRRPQEVWQETAREVVTAHLGERPPHPQRNAEPHHEPALLRSDFKITDDVEFGFESIIGCIYSGSDASRRQFGDRAAAFEADLRKALLGLDPAGVFTSKVETGVIIAMKS